MIYYTERLKELRDYLENGNIKNIGTIHSGISDEMKKDMEKEKKENGK